MSATPVRPTQVLITGGGGFVGSHLVDTLIARGTRVRVLDVLEPQVHGPGATRPRWLPPDIDFVHSRLADTGALDRALEGVDAVVHLAALVGVGQSMYEIDRYVGGNVAETAAFLDRLANGPHGVRRLVVASSMSIYGEGRYRCSACGPVAPGLRSPAQLAAREWEVRCPHCGAVVDPMPTDEDKPLFPTSVYAVTKRDQEELCLCVGRAYGIPTVALRLFNVYGSRQALSNPYTGVAAIFSARLLNGQAPPIFEDGLQTRDFVHVSDVVQALCLALETPSVTDVAINVGTGRAISILDVARLIAGKLGAPHDPEIVGRYREGDIRHCVANIERARRLLGFEPRVPVEDGLAELARWVGGERADDGAARATAQLEARGLVR